MSDFSFLDPFQTLTIPLGEWVEGTLNYLVHNFREFFRAVRWPIASSALNPVIAVMLGALIGHERFGLHDIAAMVVILVGVLVLTLARTRAK